MRLKILESGKIVHDFLKAKQYLSWYQIVAICSTQRSIGEVHPVFDCSKSGGVLMDLNIYNLHFAIDILGEPLSAQYFPQIEKG